MLYDYLHEFATISRQGSISAAADALGISQPTLSRHMDALESMLGVRLINRSTRGVTLTQEGRFTYNKAMDIESIGDSIVIHFAPESLGSTRRDLLLGGLVYSDRLQRLLANVCGGLDHSSCQISMRMLLDRAFKSIGDSLAREEVDIVATYRAAVPEHREGLFSTKVLQQQGYAVMEKSHHLADKTALTLEDLRDTPICRSTGLEFNADAQWEEINRICRSAGFLPTSRTVGINAVPGNMGNWYFPDSVVIFCGDMYSFEPLQTHGKVALPVEGLLFEIWLVTRSDDSIAVQVAQRCSQLA